MHANDTKAAASLSSSLLARKGGARPAMRRPAIQPTPSDVAAPIDDLGWNDMGEEAPLPPPAPPAASPVARQVATLHAKLSPAKTAPLPAAEGKCAFTLRLDAERHLRLRLLSAVTNQSAQRLVTQALDTLIANHPNIEELAADPKARTSNAVAPTHQKGTKP